MESSGNVQFLIGKCDCHKSPRFSPPALNSRSFLPALASLLGRHQGPPPLDISEVPWSATSHLLLPLCAVTSPEVTIPVAVSWLEKCLGDGDDDDGDDGDNDDDCHHFLHIENV